MKRLAVLIKLLLVRDNQTDRQTPGHSIYRSSIVSCGKSTISVLQASNGQNVIHSVNKKSQTRMWADTQRDGRPAEYMWRFLFNAAKFGWRPLLECRTVTLPRCETRWN